MNSTLLKSARRKLGLTQAEAARRLGVSQTYWSLLEKGERPVTADLAFRAVRVFGMSPTLLPVSEEGLDATVDSEELAKELAALGYPGFAYMRGEAPRNPGEVLVRVLAQDRIEARLAEALPWLALHFGAGLDRQWLVMEARLRNLSNRLGFVVELARGLGERLNEERGHPNIEYDENYSALTLLAQELQKSRLVNEDTLGQNLSDAEREWVRQNRTPEAAYWNVLSDWKPEYLQYA